jgi:hypothetical protein
MSTLANITSLNLSLQTGGAALAVKAAEVATSVSPIFADSTDYVTYQDAIDAGIAQSRQVIFRGGMTHNLQSNLVINGPISILIQPDAIVRIADDATITSIPNNAGTVSQYGVFQPYDYTEVADPSFGSVIIESYGSIDCNDSEHIGTGSPAINFAFSVLARCYDLSLLGTIDCVNGGGSAKLIDCDRPTIDTLYQSRDSVLAQTGNLKAEGCTNGYCKLIISENVAEPADFGGRNVVFVVDTINSTGSSAESIDINSSYGIRIVNASLYNPTRVAFINNNMNAPNFSKRPNLTVLGNHNVNVQVVIDANASNPIAAFTDIECPDVTMNLSYRYLAGANATGLANVLRMRHNATRGTTSRGEFNVEVYAEDGFTFPDVSGALISCQETQCEENSVSVKFRGTLPENKRLVDMRGSNHSVDIEAVQPSGATATNRIGLALLSTTTGLNIRSLRCVNFGLPINIVSTGSNISAPFLLVGDTAFAQNTGWADGCTSYDTTVNKALFKVAGNWVDSAGSPP